MDVVYHQGRDERYEELKLSSAPAIIVGDLVRFIGRVPDQGGPDRRAAGGRAGVGVRGRARDALRPRSLRMPSISS